jgi:hypothetical protein
MAFDVSWLEENRFGLMRYVGTLSLDDINGAYGEFNRYLTTAKRPVHLVVDITELEALNTSLTEILGSAEVQYASSHPKLGWVVYYNKENSAYNFIASAIGQNSDLRMRFCDTQEEALQFLEEVDL